MKTVTVRCRRHKSGFIVEEVNEVGLALCEIGYTVAGPHTAYGMALDYAAALGCELSYIKDITE